MNESLTFIQVVNMIRDMPVDGTHAERLALLSLVAEGAAPMSSLSARCGISRGAMTSMADRLEDQSLVVRELHPTDRRVILITPTAKGRQVVADAYESLDVA